jgi:hypothetical protein
VYSALVVVVRWLVVVEACQLMAVHLLVVHLDQNTAHPSDSAENPCAKNTSRQVMG